jgi:hypothetical protein
VTLSERYVSAFSLSRHSARGDIENQIWSILLELADAHVEVTLQFVFSHCGLPRNDEVDAEAKKATKLPQRNIPIWITDMLSAARHIRVPLLRQIEAIESRSTRGGYSVSSSAMSSSLFWQEPSVHNS